MPNQFHHAVGPVLYKLRNSPTFAMSLGSKELFHTNFLSFLLEFREPTVAPLQCALRKVLHCPMAEGEVPWCLVLREHNHLDLVIVPMAPVADAAGDEDRLPFQPSGNPCAVVEAKLKSLATDEQLHRYEAWLRTTHEFCWTDDYGASRRGRIEGPAADGSPGVRLTLLSLDGQPMPVPLPDTRWQWAGVSWCDIAEVILTFANSNDARGVPERVAQVIIDYAEQLQLVQRLMQEARHLFKRCAAVPYIEFNEAAVQSPALRQARLVDLIGKRLFEQWKEELTAREDWQEGWDAEVMFSRGVPGLTVRTTFPVPGDSGVTTYLGVQVQGLEFRHFAATSAKWPRLEESLCEHRLLASWFAAPFPSGAACGPLLAKQGQQALPLRELGKDGRLTNLRIYGADKFLYSFAKLDAQGMTLGALSGQVIASMVLATELVRKASRRPVQRGAVVKQKA